MTRFNEAIDEALTKSVARYSGRLDRSRELFLGVLGHDLRGPLGAVLNSAQYLLLSGELSGAQTKAASAIWRSGTRLQAMVSDLLDVARTRLGQTLPIARRQTDLADICRQVVEERHAHHPEHTVALTTSGNLAGMWDDARLAQMLSNLVDNAILHGAIGRPVTVSISGEEQQVLLSVHNEGNPIAESARHRIFEPLTRAEPDASDERKAGGLGLGLYIVRAIAEAHGGSVDVSSSEERGTTFTVRLPRNSDQGGSSQ
jgi:signal transduction histidine kinase